MRNDGIKKDEIEEKTPFELRGFGRAVPQALFFNPNYTAEGLPEYVEEQDWHLFLPQPNGELTLMRDAQSYKSVYFGVESADDDDIQIPFITFFYQHSSFPNIMEYFGSINEDINNLSACISKIGLYQHLAIKSNLDVSDFVLTELEYVFSVCRSLFDTLHMVTRECWSNIQLFDGGKNELPSKLSDMALSGYDPVSSSKLIEKYGIREPLADYYEELADFLSDLKYYRDSVHHYGGSFQIVYILEEGIAVDTQQEPYSEFDAWEESQTVENNLGPIWPFLSHIIGTTIWFMNKLPAAVFADIQVPPEIAPDYGVYIRGPHIYNLATLEELADDEIWGAPVVRKVKDQLSA